MLNRVPRQCFTMATWKCFIVSKMQICEQFAGGYFSTYNHSGSSRDSLSWIFPFEHKVRQRVCLSYNHSSLTGWTLLAVWYVFPVAEFPHLLLSVPSLSLCTCCFVSLFLCVYEWLAERWAVCISCPFCSCPHDGGVWLRSHSLAVSGGRLSFGVLCSG